jgi:hypothetical protein
MGCQNKYVAIKLDDVRIKPGVKTLQKNKRLLVSDVSVLRIGRKIKDALSTIGKTITKEAQREKGNTNWGGGGRVF